MTPSCGGLSAGFAKVDITPATGIHMGGYWGRTSGATDVSDALWVRALVLGSGSRRVGLAVLDLVGLGAATVARARQEVAATAGLSRDSVMVCCTHTHAGPLTLPFRGMGEIDGLYMEQVVGAVVSAIAAADVDRSDAEIYYARPEVSLGINRRQDVDGKVVIGRNPQGPTDPHAHVLSLRRPGATDIALFSHACHPVVLGNANHSISAEFPGAAARAVERRTGTHAMYINGACGDINPRKTGGTIADVAELGEELAEAVVDGLAKGATVGGDAIGAESQTVELPLIDPPSVPVAAALRAGLALRGRLARVRRGGMGYWSQLTPKARSEWARDMLALSRSGRRGLTQRFEIQGLRAGGLVLLGMEGEMLVRYQLDLEAASPFQPTVMVGYANGCVGYVPTADQFERGGYEVGSGYGAAADGRVEAYQVYPSVQMLAPQSEDVVRAGARQVMTRLAAY